MSTVRILLADNKPRFLAQCAQFLERAGYQVVSARSVEEARQQLAQTHFHLAILDNRLCDDSDQGDFSGIRLARESDPSILKIILTAFPTWKAARQAMGVCETDEPPAVSFVSKEEGMEELLRHVQRAIQGVGVNWQLRIEWKGIDLAALASRLAFPEEGVPILERGAAIEDLFRRLFMDCQMVRVEK